MHCKDKIPKFRNKYSQKRNIGASVSISTFMSLWAIYIFPQSVCLFCWRKYVDRSWVYTNRSPECGNWGWGRAIPRKGIYIWDFRYSVGWAQALCQPWHTLPDLPPKRCTPPSLALWTWCPMVPSLSPPPPQLTVDDGFLSRGTLLKELSSGFNSNSFPYCSRTKQSATNTHRGYVSTVNVVCRRSDGWPWRWHPVAEFLVPDWRDKVDYGTGLTI